MPRQQKDEVIEVQDNDEFDTEEKEEKEEYVGMLFGMAIMMTRRKNN